MTKNTTKTAREFAERKIAEPATGTSLGYHFISKYNENKWEWFLEYVRCLEPLQTPPPLVFGGAIHDALEYVYTEPDVQGMVYVFREILRSREGEYADPAVFAADLDRGPKMLFYWANQWLQHDLEQYDLLGVELPLEVPLPGGLKMTMRLDLAVQQKDTQDVFLLDHKTTGWSVSGTVSSMEVTDQATAYLYGLSQVKPDWYALCLGLIPDVIYQKGSSIKAERPTVISRAKADLTRFSLEMQGLLVEMAQKVRAFQSGAYHPYQLFPRNGKDASMYGRVSYPDLQRLPLPSKITEAPPGYRINEARMENVLRPFMDATSKITTQETTHA